MLNELPNIISLQVLTDPPPFSAYTVTITSNNLKPGKLHTVSFDLVKNPGETHVHLLGFFSFFRSVEGIAVAAVGGIDIVQLALGIFYILKVIRQLVRVIGYSVGESITRTLTRLTVV